MLACLNQSQSSNMQLRSNWPIVGLLLATAFCARADLSIVATNATREFVAQKRYLNLPVKNGSPSRRLNLLVDAKVERFFDIELAEGEPDWWAFIDLTPWQGHRFAVASDAVSADSAGFKRITLSDTIRGAENLYREPLRPQFHFSSRRGWNND